MFRAGLGLRGSRFLALRDALILAVLPLVALVASILMDKILHDPKDPKLWELWCIPYNG